MAVCMIEKIITEDSAPLSVFEKRKFFLAITKGLMPLSAELLLSSRCPSFNIFKNDCFLSSMYLTAVSNLDFGLGFAPSRSLNILSRHSLNGPWFRSSTILDAVYIFLRYSRSILNISSIPSTIFWDMEPAFCSSDRVSSMSMKFALVKKKWTQAERLLVTPPIYSAQWLEVLVSSIVPCIGQELGNRVQTRASPC